MDLKLKNVLRSPYFYAFLLGYYGVWLAWDLLKIPAHPPAGVISYLPQLGYNPASNMARFGLAVLMPPLLCLALWLLMNTNLKKNIMRIRSSRYLLPGALVTAGILLCVSMGVAGNSTNPANNPVGMYGGPYEHALLDTFHEGETLGPAISYQQPDLKPYRDFVVVHGVFQDPLRTVIAFKLFGQSIGAARTMAVLLGILAFLCYFLLLVVLFRGNLMKSAAGLVALGVLVMPVATVPVLGQYLLGVQLPFRDIATMFFLIFAILGLRAVTDRQPRRLLWCSFLIGFIALAGFANSIDRAMFVGALAVVWLALVYIMQGLRRFAKPVLVPFGVGAAAGLLVLGLALKWAFGDFIAYLLTILPFKEYLDGLIFERPNFGISLVLVLTAGMLTIGGAYLLKTLRHPSLAKAKGWGPRLRAIRLLLAPVVRTHGVTILLAATALFFLRNAIGRAVPDHFNYSITWLYLLIVYLVINHLYLKLKSQRLYFGFFVVVLLGCLLGFYGSLVKQIDIRADTFPLHVQDEKFMRTDHVEAANYLKKHLKGNERFMTLTSEGAWYYFANKPSPSKYPIIWYAFTAPERQKIADELARKTTIKYVLTNDNWTSNFDFVPNPNRFPEVYKVLYDKYKPYKGIGQQTIWIRK